MKMYAVTTVIRLLVAVVFINSVSCQEGFSEQDLLRLQQLTNPNDGQVETITSYSTNVIQRDPIRNEHSISSVNVQYHLTDDADKNNDYHRAGRSDRRKVFRIKNPFQRQLEPNESNHDENTALQDNNPGASNQYAAMQYSLPPDEFLQKMRAENQYIQQVSTPNPLLSYTATPQSQYQYPTNPSNSYENSHQSNQVNQVEPKSLQSQSYQPNPNGYQYGGSGSYSYDSVQSTASSVAPYLSSVNTQYADAPTNSYVSSASPVFLSSQPNIQQYVSSPLSVIQTGSPDYSNSVSTVSSNTVGLDPNYQNKRLQIDHYDNSGNGIRYPTNVQQYSQEYPSSTTSPSSTPYPDPIHDSWQNAINAGVHSLSKSLQELSLAQYQNSQYQNQQDARLDQHQENSQSETHRAGNIPAANNLYLDYVQPDYQTYNNMRARTRDLEHESGQPSPYSNGDYGWKMNGKKAVTSNDNYQGGNSPARYQTFGLHPDGNAVSQMNFYLDSSKPQSYDQISKSSAESRDESQEFAKAAAKAHEHMKQQQQLAKLTESYFGHNSYEPTFGHNNPNRSPQSLSTQITPSYYGNNDGQRNKLYADSSNNNLVIYGNSQPQQDLITASPYFLANSKEHTLDNKIKQPFDHAKALKNIVPIDVSNVLSNEGQSKTPVSLDNNGNRYNMPNFNREQLENIKQFYKSQSVTDSYYKDKNSGYGYNIKSKPDDITGPEVLKSVEQSSSYYGKHPQESTYNQGYQVENKRYGENMGQQINYSLQTSNYPNNIQTLSSTHSPLQENPQLSQSQIPTDITSILKLNDIPYRLTQGLNSDSLRFNNNNFDQNGIPTPIPTRINQNVGVHQLDVANNLLKLMQNKQPNLNLNSNRPDIDLQSSGLLSTINGFRVANPFNVDLKLVAEMLKGKPAIDDSQMLSLREQFTKPAPIKLDMSSLQQLLMKNDNYGSLENLNGGITALGNPYLDIYNSGRYPYQGVKYSRSQEEEESIPIADASNTHPIGAVIEQGESADAREVSEGTELTASDGSGNVYEENRPKNNLYSRENKVSERHRNPNSLLSARHSYQRKYPKSDVLEPYPLLKPPPPHHSRRGVNKTEKRVPRRRRVNRSRYGRILKSEPLFESDSNLIRTESEEVESKVPTLLRPPPSVPEARSDFDNEEVDERHDS